MEKLMLDFHFSLDWGGARKDLISVSGLSFTREVVEVNVGTSPTSTNHRTLGKKELGTVKLRRFLFSNDNEFFKWWEEQDRPGNLSKRDITIQILDKEHKPVFVYKFREAQPIRISYSALTADVAEPVWEELEILYQSVNVEASGSSKK